MNTETITSLKEALVWVVGGGGSAVAAYALVKAADNEGYLSTWTKAQVRFLSLALAVVLGVAASVGGMALGYWPWPVTTVGWCESLFSVVAIAVTASQAIHGARALRGVPRVVESIEKPCCPE